MLRITEGPFFSEVVAHYEHVHQIVRLYNLPGEPCRRGCLEGGAGSVGRDTLFLLPVVASHVLFEAGGMLHSLGVGLVQKCRGTVSPQPGLSDCGSRSRGLALPCALCPGVEGLSLDMSFLVDIRDYINKELALRIHTDINSQATFFTDLNGFQVMPGAPETPQSRPQTVCTASVTVPGGWPVLRRRRWRKQRPEGSGGGGGQVVPRCAPSAGLAPAGAAPAVFEEAAPAGQLLPHAGHGLPPGRSEPPHAAHRPGPGCLQPP